MFGRSEQIPQIVILNNFPVQQKQIQGLPKNVRYKHHKNRVEQTPSSVDVLFKHPQKGDMFSRQTLRSAA